MQLNFPPEDMLNASYLMDQLAPIMRWIKYKKLIEKGSMNKSECKDTFGYWLQEYAELSDGDGV